MTKLTKTLIDNYLKSQGTSREEITEFVVPDHLNEIDTSIYNSLLSNLFPENTITKIGYYAFYKCSALKYIIIPDSDTFIDSRAFVGCTSLTHIICNNPDAFRYIRFPTKHYDFNGNDNGFSHIAFQDAQYHNQMQFITSTDYLIQNHHDLLEAIKDSEFNTDHVSNKELNLIMKLHQEDYLPNWRTITTSFKDRSMDQIKAILDYFGKTHCMPNTKNSISFKQQDKSPAVVEGISMFLNPTDHAKLSMTAKNVTFRTNEESASNCSIQ